jgi:hypothetical protein
VANHQRQSWHTVGICFGPLLEAFWQWVGVSPCLLDQFIEGGLAPADLPALELLIHGQALGVFLNATFTSHDF